MRNPHRADQALPAATPALYQEVWNQPSSRQSTSAIVPRVAHLPWVLDLHTHPDMLDQLTVLIASIPLPVIIDRFGGVDAGLGVDQPAFRTLLDLVGEDNVWIKISGANRLIARGSQYSDVVELARALITRAPDRVLWGTEAPFRRLRDRAGAKRWCADEHDAGLRAGPDRPPEGAGRQPGAPVRAVTPASRRLPGIRLRCMPTAPGMRSPCGLPRNSSRKSRHSSR